MENPLNTFDHSVEDISDLFLPLKESAATLIEKYIDGNICVHIHIFIKARAELESGDHCPFIKIRPDFSRSPAYEMVGISDHLNASIDSQCATKMDFALLIDNAHFVKNIEEGNCIRLPEMVRLHLLNDIPCLLTQAPNAVDAAGRRWIAISFRGGEFSWIVKDRKLCLFERRSLFPNRQFVNGLIQRRTEVMESFSGNNRPIFRNRSAWVIDENKLFGLQIVLLQEGVGSAVGEPLKLRLKSFQLLSGASEFQARIFE